MIWRMAMGTEERAKNLYGISLRVAPASQPFTYSPASLPEALEGHLCGMSAMSIAGGSDPQLGLSTLVPRPCLISHWVATYLERVGFFCAGKQAWIWPVVTSEVNLFLISMSSRSEVQRQRCGRTQHDVFRWREAPWRCSAFEEAYTVRGLYGAMVRSWNDHGYPV